MKASGRCLCGAVSYTAETPKTEVHGCHCSICQRWSGGPAMAVGTTAMAIDGEEQLGRYASSDWAERGFCKRCGSHLFYHLKESGQYYVWMGSLDEPGRFKLAGEIFVDQKPPGYAFAGDHPRMTGEEFMATMQQD